MNIVEAKRDLLARRVAALLDNCDQVGECWIPRAVPDRKGYIRARNEWGVKEPVHWIMWRFFREERPEELTFDHFECQNPSCCNPWHGDPVPDAVNRDRQTRGVAVANRAKTHCPQGHPYAGNLVASDAANGIRRCRICKVEAQGRYRAKVSAK